MKQRCGRAEGRYPSAMRHLFSFRWLAPLGVLLTTAAVTAQESFPNYTAPSPNTGSPPKVWLSYLVMAVLVGAVLAISLTPAKRGHQD
jgi:hypothetical protein